MKVSKKDIAARIAELEAGSAQETLSSSARYKKGRDAKVLKLIHDCVNLDDVSEEGMAFICQLVSPNKYEEIEVSKGDKILDLVSKYSDRKDVIAKITKAAEKAGLSVNLNKGIIE